MPLESPVSGWVSVEGSPYPLGVTWVEADSAYNFALYSKHAHQVEVCLFDPDDLTQPHFAYTFDFLRNKSGPIWHCRISKDHIGTARYYAYRIDGPNPMPGFSRHNFDPEKLLLDPYATSIIFPPQFDRQAAIEPGSNVARAPLAVLEDVRSRRFDWGKQASPRHEADLIIYEMHVRGFTQDESSGLPETKRGTYAGVIEKIPYLKELGITAVELMPVFQFDPDENNYSGYMPLNFFAPHHAYASSQSECSQFAEFREMVRALHAEGIEVILDVVYNHTGEGDQHGPTYSFKGIDNSSYYMLTHDPAHPYADYTGTGNTLHTRNRAVRQLIMDSLRHWVVNGHVDGFRFDLASIFARKADGSVSPEDAPIFGEIASHTELADIRLIAEPWNAYGLFQLGERFPGTKWMQWNAGFRDTVQRFIRGDAGMVDDLMARIYGSADLFPDDLHHAFHLYQSINYISCHDGLTLYDLTAYNRKNNWVNGLKNLDGPDDFSWDCGWEGNVDLPEEVLDLRKRQVKNFVALLMLSNGTPMFRMGDEFLNSQQGNSNPYNQDNETSWLNWTQLEEHCDIFRFFKLMIAFRKGHRSLSRSRFWRDDIRWHGAERAVDLSHESQQLAYCLRGASEADVDLYVMINSSPNMVSFGIHDGAPGEWHRVIDTAKPSPSDIFEPQDAKRVDSSTYDVGGRSVVVLTRELGG